MKCKCPYGFHVKVNTPIGKVNVGSEDPVTVTELDAKVAPVSLNIKFNTNGYTFLCIVIFLA